MNMVPDVINAWRRLDKQLRYQERRAAQPFSQLFRAVAVLVSQHTQTASAVEMLPSWWVQRFPTDRSAMSLLDTKTVTEWAEAYFALGDLIPFALTRAGQAGLYALQYFAEWSTMMWLLEQNAKSICPMSRFVPRGADVPDRGRVPDTTRL